MSAITIPAGFTSLPVWLWRPNWKDPVVETYEFLTQVITDDAGNEQRFGQRLTPRRSFSYSVLVNSTNRNRFEMAVNFAGGLNWYFPIWPEAFTAAGLTAGQNTILRDMSFTEFLVGALCLVTDRDGLVAEVLVINSVSTTSMTFTTGLVNNYSNAYVVPLFVGHLTTLPQLSRETDDMMSGTVSYQSQKADFLYNPVGVSDALPSYIGYPVLATSPDYNQTNPYNLDRLLPVADGNTGLITYFDFADYGFRAQTNTWFIYGRKANVDFKVLLYTTIGRLKSIWLPTFNRDIVMLTNTTAGSTSFQAAKAYLNDWGGITTGDRRRGIIFFNDSTPPLCVDFTGYDDSNPLYDIFDVGTEFLVPIAVANVARICFMSLGRVDSDSISLSHETDVNGVALSTIPFRNLKVQPA